MGCGCVEAAEFDGLDIVEFPKASPGFRINVPPFPDGATLDLASEFLDFHLHYVLAGYHNEAQISRSHVSFNSGRAWTGRSSGGGSVGKLLLRWLSVLIRERDDNIAVLDMAGQSIDQSMGFTGRQA